MTAGRQWQPAPAGGVPPAKRHGHSLALVGVADALRHHPPTDAPHPALSCLLRLSPGTSAESCNAGGGSGRRPPRGGGWVVGTILWSRGHRPGRPGAGMGRPAMRRRRVATPPAARPPQRRTGAAATAAGRRSRVEPGAGPRGPHGAQGVCVRGGWEAALLNQNEKKKTRKRRQPPPRAVRADAAVTPRSLQRGGTKAADVTPWAQDRRGRAAGPAGEPPHAPSWPPSPPLHDTPHLGWGGVPKIAPDAYVWGSSAPFPIVGPRMGARQRVPNAGQGRRPSWSACHLSVGGMGEGRAPLPPPGRPSNRAVAHAGLPAKGHALTVR